MIDGFFLTKWFFYLLRWLCSILGNSYFGAILLTTLLLRLIQIYPDIKSRRSQKKQQAMQPELEKLQKKYENNPEKLREEQTKLMKANGVSLMAGCLPMLITLPLFFCFLSAFRYWSYEHNIILTYESLIREQQIEEGIISEGDTTLADETFASYRFLWITNIWQPDSGFESVVADADRVISRTPKKGGSCSCSSEKYVKGLVIFNKGYTNLYGEEVSAEEIWQTLKDGGIVSGEFGGDDMQMLPDDTDAKVRYNNLMSRYSNGYNNGFFILPILAAGFQFLASWLPMRLNKKKNPEAAKQEQSMQFMMWLFPIMSFIFCLTEGSAFALYWVISSIFQLASTLIVSYFVEKDTSLVEIKPAPAKSGRRKKR